MSSRRERAKAKMRQQISTQAVTAVAVENDHPIAKKLGDFFIDVAKLIIGGVIGVWLINYANKKRI
jgi:hypothetical protein